ncbi:SDR family NAD(P)-dependent oxidoreductase [Hydrogenophaga sp.]|uniref:SDR family NAD(P)-dependent oxidoreductase n=1 Tax=Hydrogenophaga sp. TaxID=1904254 RepID=UPI003AF657AB
MSADPIQLPQDPPTWAVVTGASEGIGRAFAQALAARGYSLVLVARRGPLLVALANELKGAYGTECPVFEADLARPGSIASLVMATCRLDVDMLVAAAGFGTSGDLLDAPLEAELGMLDLNCSSVLALCWHFGQRFRQRGGGNIVLMSSLLAFHGVPRAAHYAATKAYVQTLAEGLRVELAPYGIDVIASAPGPVATGFALRANLKMSRALDPQVVARQTLHALGRKTTVRPGWLSKLLGWSLAILPRWGQVRVITQVMKGMTAHQDREREASQLR